ncbi:hypothetical protein BDQ17DRAFT_25786 [Cyathus striatus]|nr:hypothetical protein BDQ17DRAFT_25786 [Cyathus striatus]
MRPSKKPRYSQSPSRPESTTPSPPEDKEREFFSRDPPSDIGLGRPESIFHHTPVSASSAGPRRPGSGTGRRAMAVSDLVSSTDKERSIASANLQSSHDRPSLRVVSPLGRRSPPGSLAGRAIAARKTDDSTVSMMVVEKKEPVTVSIPPPPPPPPREYSAPTQIVIPESEPRLPEPVKKVKEEPVALKAPPREVRPPPPPPQPPVVDSIPKKSKDKSHPPKEVKDHPRPRPTPKEQQKAEDAHDWLLEHYAREPSPEPSPRPEPPHSPSPSISPIVAASPSRPSMSALAEHQSSSPEPKKRSPSPLRTATPPAEAAIEELEELVAETEAEIIPKTTIVNKQEPLDVDMDLDELVAETLNGGEDNAGKRQEEEEEEEEMFAWRSMLKMNFLVLLEIVHPRLLDVQFLDHPHLYLHIPPNQPRFV